MTTQIAVRDEQRLDRPMVRVDGWLVLAADLPAVAPGQSAWDALQRAATSPGPAKLAMVPGTRTLVVRADVPVDDGIDVESRAREARDGMNRLANAAEGGVGTPSCTGTRSFVEAGADRRAKASCCTSADSRAEDVDHSGGSDLAALAGEAGWAFARRASGRLAIDLGVPGHFYQAIVAPRHAGGCRARVELARQGEVADESRTAVAVLLLTLAHVVRFVRAGAEPRDSTTSVFVEVDIENAATASELHHALSALSVACRAAGREVKALLDSDVARTYLAARGWAVSSTR